MVRLYRISSNHCHEGGSRATGKVRVSSGRFEYTKPPRTTFLQARQAYREGSSKFGVVRIHRTSSNHCHEGEAGRKGSLESVREGSTVPN